MISEVQSPSGPSEQIDPLLGLQNQAPGRLPTAVRRQARADAIVTLVALLTGLWLGMGAPAVSPVSPPVSAATARLDAFAARTAEPGNG